MIEEIYTHEVSPAFYNAHAYGGLTFNGVGEWYMRGAGFGYGWGDVDVDGGGGGVG